MLKMRMFNRSGYLGAILAIVVAAAGLISTPANVEAQTNILLVMVTAPTDCVAPPTNVNSTPSVPANNSMIRVLCAVMTDGGAPVPGVTITFSVGTGVLGGGSVKTATAVTSNAGVAWVTYSGGGNQAGIDTAVASSAVRNAVTSLTITLTAVTPPPSTASATKSCLPVANGAPNTYSCTLTVTPGVATAPNASLLVNLDGAHKLAAPVTMNGTTGCGSIPAPAGSAGVAAYTVSLASGCTAQAVLVFNETIEAPSGGGQICEHFNNVSQVNVTASACTNLVPGAPPSGCPAGTIVGSIPPSGIGLIVYCGGSLSQLVSATGCPVNTMQIWTIINGQFVAYIPGITGPLGATVNASFLAYVNAFPGGAIPAITPFVVQCA